MSEHERETAFWRQCILYDDDAAERQRLEEKLAQIQRNNRCVRRAVWLMALLAALAMVGLGYSAILLEDYPQNATQALMQFSVKAFCVLGLAALICMLAFVGLERVYRRDWNQQREECRRLATRLLESHFGKRPAALTLSAISNKAAELGEPARAVATTDFTTDFLSLNNSKQV